MKPYTFAVILLLSALFPAALKGASGNGPVEMQIKRVLLDPMSNAPVVILESVAEKKILPIWIGPAEATSIAQELEQVGSPRPNTHDLIRNILKSVGATVVRITITDLRQGTYYATITLRMGTQDLQIDSRPSDAIAVALRTKSAVFATPEVLSKAQPLPALSGPSESLRETIGIQLQDLTPELASLLGSPGTQGVLVADVVLGSPAMAAGLSRGDVIVKVNDTAVQKSSQVESALKKIKKPARVKLDILRKAVPTSLVVDLR